MEFIEFAQAHFSFILTLVATGMIAGLLAGLLGVGGGIVIVPVLYFLLQRQGVSAPSAMLVATATSLATMIPTSLSSIRAHRQKGNVDIGLLKRWGVFIIAGVLMGSLLVTKIDGRWLSALFAVIAIMAAVNMVFRQANAALFTQLPRPSSQHLMGGGIGFFSAMVGIGGGTISVPLLTLYNYPAHRAVGTAAAIGLLIAAPGALTMLIFGVTPTDAPMGTWGLVNLPGFLCIVPMTVLFAPLGAALGARFDGVRLKKIFAVVLFFTGGRMLWQFVSST